MQREAIRGALSFLTEYGFAEAEAASETGQHVVVRFTSSRMTIEASFNDRDSFDVGVRFLNHGGTSVSVGTLIAALKVGEGRVAQSHRDVLVEQARWLQLHLQEVLDAPPAVADDCHALRFYHAGAWRKEWGKTIVMDVGTRDAERLRLDRLRNYFGPIGGRPNTPLQPTSGGRVGVE